MSIRSYLHHSCPDCMYHFCGLLKALQDKLCYKTKTYSTPVINFNVKTKQQLVFKGVKAMILTTEEKVMVSIDPRTPAGNPARVDGVPMWTVSDPAVCSVAPAPDGMSAEVVSMGLGSALVTVEFDADLDEDEVRTLTGGLDITVVEPEAINFTINAGTPVIK